MKNVVICCDGTANEFSHHATNVAKLFFTLPKALLEKFDKNVVAARAAIAGASDEDLLKTWSLLAGGQTLFTMPRIECLRSFVMNHTIHHRAQLTVYLRLNDIPVPALYGPSADEGGM